MVDLIQNLFKHIINPIILGLMALSVVYFLWGLSAYVRDGVDDRVKARDKIVWGLVGLFLLVSGRGLINLLIDTMCSISGKCT